MAPIESGPIQVPGRAGEVGQVQRPRPNFAANEDGPWVRSPAQFQVEMRRLLDELHEAKDLALDDPVGLLPRLLYAEGAWAAANWTLGLREDAPVSLLPMRVNDRSMRLEVSTTNAVAKDDNPATVMYARGAMGWFAWLAGVLGTVPYEP